MLRKHSLAFLPAMLALVVAGCSETPWDPTELVAGVEVAPDTATLAVGSTRLLAVQVRGVDGTPIHGFDVTWTSENEAVARVASNGTVTAVSEGIARIRATAAGHAGRATVTVVRAPLASLEIHGDSVRTLERGESTQLIAIGRNAAGEAQNGVAPEWATSDENVVWASNSGGVVALRGGTVTITAMFQGRTASVRVRVPAITWISVLPDEPNIPAGGSARVRAEVHTESGVRAMPVQWASENPEIAVVDAAGRITPVRPGVAVIRATAEGVTGRTTITVAGERQPLHAISANGSALPVELHTVLREDAAGNPEFLRLVLVGSGLALTTDGRYTIRSYVHYAKDGVVRSSGALEDSGQVYYDFLNGDLILRSERYAGRESRGAFEYANGYPTGGVLLTHRIGADGPAIPVLYRQ